MPGMLKMPLLPRAFLAEWPPRGERCGQKAAEELWIGYILQPWSASESHPFVPGSVHWPLFGSVGRSCLLDPRLYCWSGFGWANSRIANPERLTHPRCPFGD